MTEDQIYDLLTELASIDTNDTNLRDNPKAYEAVERALASSSTAAITNERLNRLPVFAWASTKQPKAIHHQVKDLWLKVCAEQVEDYSEPLVLLADVRSSFAAQGNSTDWLSELGFELRIDVEKCQYDGVRREWMLYDGDSERYATLEERVLWDALMKAAGKA